MITQADSGRTVPLPAGQDGLLQLSSAYTWSEPQASGGAVRLAPAGTARGARQWVVAATGRGTARVTAQGRPACSPGQLCSALVLAFSVTIAVS